MSADSLESSVNRNTVRIHALKTSIDFASAQVETLKADMEVVNLACESNNQKLSQTERRINEAERYQRRWNLRLHGIPENKQEKTSKPKLQMSAVPSSERIRPRSEKTRTSSSSGSLQ